MSYLAFLLDRITKTFVQVFFEEGKRHYIIGDVISITYVVNTGGLFGFLQDYPTFFTIASGVLIIGIYFYTKRARCHPAEKFLWSMILGGATGNLFDRLLWGGVIDFLDIGYKSFRWPVFNVADIFIFVGVLLLFFLKHKKCTQPS